MNIKQVLYLEFVYLGIFLFLNKVYLPSKKKPVYIIGFIDHHLFISAQISEINIKVATIVIDTAYFLSIHYEINILLI